MSLAAQFENLLREAAQYRHAGIAVGVWALHNKDAILTALRAQEWQPMETAPKGKPGFLAIDADETSIEWLIDHGHPTAYVNQNSCNNTSKFHWKGWVPVPPITKEPA